MTARSSSRWVRLGATAVAAVVVAEAAAWLLRPRDIEHPVHADENAYFSHEELTKARDYASGQRLILVGSLVAEGAVLVLLATGRPAVTRRTLDRLAARPVLGGAAAAAGLSVVVAVVTVPFGIAAHERSVDAGLSTQSLGGWFGDWTKATAIGAILAGLVGSFALGLMRRFGGRWWIPGSVAVVIAAGILTWLAPVVLAPLFNKFERLPPGQARSDVLALARKAGVDVGQVYRVDASRRTTAINAYVNGIGSSKRVVLYDTLLNDLNRGERSSVVAHELGHVHGNDIQRGLLFVAIVTPLALIFASGMAAAIARRRGAEPGQPAYLPAFALAIALTSFVIGIAGNQLSRAVEARADTFSLQLTNDPSGMIELQQQLADRNLSDPDPPGVFTFLFGTHPPAVDRIGAALAWEQGKRP
ncbi:MAG TPA: M48 family metallopeptidase [Solirubrobacterales bacterium]|nr:M48 family metallopeptidase [Solirubrobacterales bacterium]